MVAMLLQAIALYELEPEIGFRKFHLGAALAHYALFSMVAIAVLDSRGNYPKSWKWLAVLALLGSVASVLPLPTFREFPTMTGMVAIHLLLSSLAYGVFIASLAQMTETFLVGRSIAHHESRVGEVPALLDMEKTVFHNVTIGFALLTLTVATGAFLYVGENTSGVDYLTHKNVFAVLTWILCAILIFGRQNRGWRGIIALRWLATSTVCLVLSYLGTIFVLDLILGR